MFVCDFARRFFWLLQLQALDVWHLVCVRNNFIGVRLFLLFQLQFVHYWNFVLVRNDRRLIRFKRRVSSVLYVLRSLFSLVWRLVLRICGRNIYRLRNTCTACLLFAIILFYVGRTSFVLLLIFFPADRDLVRLFWKIRLNQRSADIKLARLASVLSEC